MSFDEQPDSHCACCRAWDERWAQEAYQHAAALRARDAEIESEKKWNTECLAKCNKALDMAEKYRAEIEAMRKVVQEGKYPIEQMRVWIKSTFPLQDSSRQWYLMSAIIRWHEEALAALDKLKGEVVNKLKEKKI